MMNKIIEWLKSMRVVLLSATAVLVAVPLLINAGIDIYEAVQKIPKGAKERQNVELFQTHFKESPIFTAPLVVKAGGESRQINIDVYENGDILVLYGQSVQWFSFKPQMAAPNINFINRAYAAEAVKGTGRYVQTTDIEDGNVVQQRVYANDVKEMITIDKNSGRVLSTETSTAPPTERLKQGQKGVLKAKPVIIDIDQLKRK